jgi:calcineurin-like phosphoesterase family protein
MSRIFFTADQHFGDDRFHIFPRPFFDLPVAHGRLVYEWNHIVSSHDTVYVVGDFAIQEKYIRIANRLNGHKILIKGNYDKLADSAYEPYFDKVVNYIDINLEAKDGSDIPCRVQHFPARSIPDRFNIVGHVHGAWRVQKNMLNVGVDVHFFQPISDEQVAFFYKAICEFYDDDVWVGTHRANMMHDYRGKKGTYW